ncbi:PDZ domain-containing protein [Tamlana agarivorans]|uniref:PDZ domain-containing protein n=1 Tax=Pseudotamlana agarivorans TaxID=481183 RepID=A0ACC5U8R9_9FLAO|nr:PDZ domain-containing protein [Tamlana agarivorans]MBU2950733.1 PDZ domain-containing protein [Tamlana agarivorans]
MKPTNHSYRLIKRSILAVSVLFLACSCAKKESQKSTIIYVGAANTSQTGVPVNSLEEAFEKATALRNSGDTNTAISIQLAAKSYHLKNTISISPLLSNLTLLGAENGQTIIKGSQTLTLPWEPYKNNIWVANVPEGTSFDQLYLDGEKQILARYPNYNEAGGHWQGFAADAIAPERIKTWSNPKGGIFHAMHGGEWGGFHFLITGVDEHGEATLSKGHQNNRPARGIHDTYRMVENIFEELDSEKEWYLNKEENKLYLYVSDATKLKKATVEVVRLKHLIDIIGTVDNPVKNISIKNIQFEHSSRTIMEEYEPLLRSDWTIYRGGALFLEGTEKVTIQDCELSNLGGNVIFVSNYNKDVNIKGNHIHDSGASAISFVGSPTAVRSPSFQYNEFVDYNKLDTIAGPKNELYPRSCIADNNLIHRIGRLEKQTAGVEISMAMDITVSNNSIYEVPRAGINIGDGTWGGHILEYNDVFATVLESGDHGAFNSWGRDRFWHPKREVMDSIVALHPKMVLWDAIHTTIIRNNRFRCDHGWDIDLDDGSTNYEIYNNVCLNGGIKLREGFHRTAENNIIINNGFHPHVWFKDNGDVFRKNILMGNHKDIFLEAWGKEVDYNLFPTEKGLKNEQSKGIEAHSTFGNPQFVNPSEGDYTVAESSPALKIGFKNIPMNQFGVKKPTLKKLAKTPNIPKLWPVDDESAKTATIEWMGATLKSVTTMEERSAAGLNKTAGVVILNIAKESIIGATTLKKGDVIVKYDENDVDNIMDLMNVYQKYIWKEHLDVVIYRNQKPMNLTIKTKK